MNPRLIYLVQTDTTVGFLSQNSDKLSCIKQRDKNQLFLTCTDSLKTLEEFTRVPNKFKKQIRRSKTTTYIYPNNKAIRVIKDEVHLIFLKKLSWTYSSSANLTKKTFKMDYAKQKADIIVEDSRGFFESKPSNLMKINNIKVQKLR